MLYCSVDKVLGSFRRYDDIETAELTLQEAMAHDRLTHHGLESVKSRVCSALTVPLWPNGSNMNQI